MKFIFNATEKKTKKNKNNSTVNMAKESLISSLFPVLNPNSQPW